MKGSDIRKLVLVKMEEQTPFGPDSGENLLGLGDDLNEVKPIYEYIDESLPQAADEMLLLCPIHRLTGVAVDGSANLTAEADPNDAAIGTIEKPLDWLRLHTLQMQGWERPVHNVVTPESAVYQLQFNRWTRGTTEKPVVTDDGRKLRYYSLPEGASTGHQIQALLYIVRFSEQTDYPTEVSEVIALNTARKVYEAFGNTEQMAAMQKEIEAVMNLMAA